MIEAETSLPELDHAPLSTVPVKRHDVRAKLKEVFGFSQFRGIQQQIVEHILSGKNTFVIMPTGAGKSLCYQLPAVVEGGTAIVISPLIALMKNQVDQMNAVGVAAEFLNSTLSKSEMNRVRANVLAGKTKLLYVAPESITKEDNIAFLRRANISFIAIDEAHCISEWGHDFRPEYRRIRFIVDQLGNLPVIALTATATPKVQLDIQKNLSMEEASVFKTSFNRANLYYEVQPKRDTKKQLIRFVKQRMGESGIVYCLSRKRVEEIAELLRLNGVKALPYHAGLEPQVRMRNQDQFLNEDCEVVVATIAFGMGIDKPDVRFVIHYDAPKSIEGYYQETGRGGRDGMDGTCLMFYAYEDIQKLDKFNKDKSVTERDNARHLLDEMAFYSESGMCRRKQLLHYFGEGMEGDCGFCDNCEKPTARTRESARILLVLEALQATEERFGARHIADMLTGTMNDYIESYGHHKLPMFGAGKEHTARYWYSLIRQCCVNGLAVRDIDNLSILHVTEAGHAFIKAPYEITIVADHDFSQTDAEEDDGGEGGPNGRAKSYDEVLFAQLKHLVKEEAHRRKLPPYVIFQDPSLAEMATTYPLTEQDLSQVIGVGMGKAKKFGESFIKLINAYVEENDIETSADVLMKSSAARSKAKIEIINLIDRKMDLEELSDSRKIDMRDLITEIENICFSGTKLNLDYYIDGVLDEDKQEEIEDFFMQSHTDDVDHAIKTLGEDYSEEEIRLMRIKFFSEHAN
jgi:ATP-dependent DNA helicase RecQ